MTHNIREQLQATLGSGYTLGRELGGGGMSRVFVAEEHRLKRNVVVKLLSPELAQGLSVERFEREIRTAAALQQANIVPVLTAGESHGLPFYTMPYVEGESLRARLERGPLAVTEIIGVLRDVSKALAYAPRHGVVHRDIKPDNVLLSEGTAVVTDFGIAKAITAARTESGAATLTQIGTSIGTPAYMAPEQAGGDPDVDHRADLYSLGAMAYELCTGQSPFGGRTPHRMLAAHLGEAARPVTELRPELPAALAELVMRCLAKEPADRPQSAAEITRILETVTSGTGMEAMPAVLLGGPGMLRKALAIYAAAFLVVAVLARAAIVGIGLPDWVFPGSLVVMALGLPVVLWTGYVQHVTRRAMAATPTFTPGGTRTAARHGTLATMALRAAPHVSWYRTARGGMYALGVFALAIAVFMGLRAAGVGPFGTLLAAGRLERHDALLLTDFRTTNTDSTLGRVVSDAVRAGLSGSRAFALVSPAAIVSGLRRMQLPPETRVDSGIARQIALRDGIKAIVDGEITGVQGGYIVTVRLVRADSGIELASFRETGDGPRGLIEASDKLARAIRSKAGESLRDINATPPLTQATTASLPALRKFSEAGHANAVGDRRALQLAREAVALDSNFASAWSSLAAMISNYGGAPRAAIDSALERAFRLRNRVPERERDRIVARYYAMGPGRDRSMAIAAYDALLQNGDSSAGVPVNLGELLRSRREFARAESLNLATIRREPGSGTALGNAIELQLNQGKLDDAARNVARLREVAKGYGLDRQFFLYHARGDDRAIRALIDSLRTGPYARATRGPTRSLALRDGRLGELRALTRRYRGDTAGAPEPRTLEERLDRMEWPDEVAIEAFVLGNTRERRERLDRVIASIPWSELAEVDRPYLMVAAHLARAGSVDKARAMVARMRAEVKDTSLLRVWQSDLHAVLGEIALAEGRTADALREFRRGDIGYDGAPAHECAPCLPFDLGRVFDAAGQADSAIVQYERYLATPYWLKPLRQFDPIRVPYIHERLGHLYEAVGNQQKAAENLAAFVALWKNADPELQPRVAAAREKLRRMSLDAPRSN